MLNPFFSIIIPVYNRATEVQQAIQSVLAQSFQHFEILVIDDASTDHTLQVLQTFAGLPQVTVLKNTRTKGACGARNTGLYAAKGEWIAFLDSDDYFFEHKLQEMYSAIQQHPQYKAFYSAYAQNERHQTIATGFTGNHTHSLTYTNEVRGLSVFVAEKQLLLAIDGFDETFKARQDVDLYFRLSFLTPFYFINQPLLCITTNANNRITQNQHHRFSGWLSFYQKHRSTFTVAAQVYQTKRLLHFAWVLRQWNYGFYFLGLHLKYQWQNTFLNFNARTSS